jgi:hypothetical protein
MGFWRQVLEWILLLFRALEFLLGIIGTTIRSTHLTLIQVLGLGADLLSVGTIYTGNFYGYDYSYNSGGTSGLGISTVSTLPDECV